MSHHTWDAYTPCHVPLRRVEGAFNINLSVHEGIVADVWEAHRRWKALGGPQFFLVRQADTGCYACRNSVAHSRALAIDFNWQSQPMGPKRTPCPQLPSMKEFYEKCWKPIGYGWGANWSSKCDAMHISKIPSEGGDGLLYVTHETEEDWLDMATEAQVRKIIREELDRDGKGIDEIWNAVRTSEGKDRLDVDFRAIKNRDEGFQKALDFIANAELVEIQELQKKIAKKLGVPVD